VKLVDHKKLKKQNPERVQYQYNKSIQPTSGLICMVAITSGCTGGY
jgi:hypothetical protein